MQKIWIIGFFLEIKLHWQFEVGKKNPTSGYFRLHIYLHTNKTLIHNSLYVLDKWGKNSSHKKIQYNYSTKTFTWRSKPIRVIGDPGNLRPDKWSSTVRRKNNCHGPRYMSVYPRFHPSNHSVTQSRLSVTTVTPACLIAIRHFNTYSTTTPHSSITSHWSVRRAGQAARITSLVYDLGFLYRWIIKMIK
jgi:hypothetical protein